MLRERVVAAIGILAGAALVGGVVVWRLAGSTYRADVETICNAESRSGLGIRKDMPALGEWLRGHLATPEGNELLSTLGERPLAERADRLPPAAGALGIAACPMAEAYEQLVADGDYRAELQRLCSYVTFPELGQTDDPARLQTLEDWIDTQASDPRTKALADPLRAAATPAARRRHTAYCVARDRHTSSRATSPRSSRNPRRARRGGWRRRRGLTKVGPAVVSAPGASVVHGASVVPARPYSRCARTPGAPGSVQRGKRPSEEPRGVTEIDRSRAHRPGGQSR